MVVLYASQETLEVALMPACSFMLCPLEFGVFDIGTAMLAPIFWLWYSLAGQTAKGVWRHPSTYCGLPMLGHGPNFPRCRSIVSGLVVA